MLTLPLTLQDRLALDDNTEDALITAFIKFSSGLIEGYCNRKFARVENAEFEFIADRTELCVDRYPVESVTRFDLQQEDGTWAEQTVGCIVRNKCVISLRGQLGSADDQARVIYTGGYVLPGSAIEDGQTPLPPDVDTACVETSAWLYQQKDKLGLSSIAMGDGTISMQVMDLPKHVKSLLENYVRKNW